MAAQFVTRWLLCLSAFTSPPCRAPRSGLAPGSSSARKARPAHTVIGRRLRRRVSRRAPACELRHAVAAKLRFRPAWDVSARQFSSFLGCNQLSLRGSHLSIKTRSSAVKKWQSGRAGSRGGSFGEAHNCAPPEYDPHTVGASTCSRRLKDATRRSHRSVDGGPVDPLAIPFEDDGGGTR